MHVHILHLKSYTELYESIVTVKLKTNLLVVR